MRLTIGMLRQVIREEVEAARRGRLYESMDTATPREEGAPPSAPEELRAELEAAAAKKRHTVLDSDKIVKMSSDECDDFGFPKGTLYCNVGGIEPYLKFPRLDGSWSLWKHESQAQA